MYVDKRGVDVYPLCPTEKLDSAYDALHPTGSDPRDYVRQTSEQFIDDGAFRGKEDSRYTMPRPMPLLTPAGALAIMTRCQSPLAIETSR